MNVLYPTIKNERVQASGAADFLFWCPGCECCHGIWTTQRNGMGATWSFNGDLEKPTFSPSLLIRHTRPVTGEEYVRIMAGEKLNLPELVCHSFIRDGVIEFLGDCTHKLRGQKVPMTRIPGDEA